MTMDVSTMPTDEVSDLDFWKQLADDLVASEEGVERGRMMSSDAVKFGGKVFAFYTAKGRFQGLGVRVGRDLDVFSLKLGDWEYLAPFTSKPPMMDWILIGAKDRVRWPEMAHLGLSLMQSAATLESARKKGRK